MKKEKENIALNNNNPQIVNVYNIQQPKKTLFEKIIELIFH